MKTPPDQHEREIALDPTRSFIVEAPAGSGKTTLLVQRFLSLLATRCQSPEEILAITFTRKAASEMRSRIITALQTASSSVQPKNSNEDTTQQLARQVLKKNHQRNWQLLANPNRLRLLTIDALCLNLTRQMPMLSQFSGLPSIVEDAIPYYQEAAESLLNDLEDQNQPWQTAIATLLMHLDNNVFQLKNLLANMLAKRDLWLPHLVNQQTEEERRHSLESNLQLMITEHLTQCENAFPAELVPELINLLNFAGQYVDNENSPLYQLSLTENFPNSDLASIKYWLAISTLLLTNEGEWRRQVTKLTGFPAASSGKTPVEKAIFKTMKTRMQHFLDEINTNAHLKTLLAEIKILPPMRYTNQQWDVLMALTTSLPVLAGYLTVIFQKNHIADFCEITLAAERALGEIDNPTDLSLYLDYKIQHILVDEFQDTSITQHRLLMQLTAGWEPNDGRTLFFVGDPMQSIYRFRQAEVGLFPKVKTEGLGDIQLTAITLKTNFRSHENLVNWINNTSLSYFPSFTDITIGAIPYTPSISYHASMKKAIEFHSDQSEEQTSQAKRIVEIINKAQKENPHQSIAVLVRSRTHVVSLIPTFQQAQLNFAAIEIENLATQPIILDLLALTRALIQPGDRIAWLSILRAPWCGLRLVDIQALIGNDFATLIWKQITDENKIKQLSEDGQKRLAHLRIVIANALANHRRLPFNQWIKQIWLALDGPACLQKEIELEYAHTFFELLSDLEKANELESINLLEAKIKKLYAKTTNPNATIQIMTIHKAKGLEFNTVIIPHLEKTANKDKHQLLLWAELPHESKNSNLLIAPIQSASEKEDRIYQFLQYLENKKGQHELARLLYVGMTRTKDQLHLLASIPQNENSAFKPKSGSLLALIWPTTADLWNKSFYISLDLNNAMNETNLKLYRLSSDWKRRTVMTLPSQSQTLNKTSIDFNNHHYERTTGTFVHHILDQLSKHNQLDHYLKNISGEYPYWKARLLSLGLSNSVAEESIVLIEQAIKNMLNDERGLWILSSDHRTADSELAITMSDENDFHHLRIDRTFVDKMGNRWIIDYKLSQPSEGQTVSNFIEEQYQQHQQQLQQYAQGLKNIDSHPIHLGLYFPLLPAWHEWLE